MKINRRNSQRTTVGSTGFAVVIVVTISVSLVFAAMKTMSDVSAPSSRPSPAGQASWYKSSVDAQIVDDAPVVRSFVDSPDMVQGIGPGVRVNDSVGRAGVASECEGNLTRKAPRHGALLFRKASSGDMMGGMPKPGSTANIAKVSSLLRTGLKSQSPFRTADNLKLLVTSGNYSNKANPSLNGSDIKLSGYGSNAHARGLLLKEEI